MRVPATLLPLSMGLTGPEQLWNSTVIQADLTRGGADSGAPMPTGIAGLDPDLRDVIAAWPDLPAPIRAALANLCMASRTDTARRS